MKKVILCSFGLLLLLAITYLYLSSPPKSTNNIPATQASSTHVSPPTQAKPTPPSTPPAPARLTGQALTDKLNEGMAKLARSNTPELQREMLRVRIKMRNHMYQNLFASWNLEPSTADKVLELIREREMEYMDAEQTLNETGMSGLKTWRASRDAARTWAEDQLLLLLDHGQLQQLTQSESSFTFETAAKGLKIANDIANRAKMPAN